MRSHQDLARAAGDLGDRGAESGNDGRMVAVSIGVDADWIEAVGINNRPANAAVAADPSPAERAWGVAGRRNCRQHDVAGQHFLTIADRAADLHWREAL